MRTVGIVANGPEDHLPNLKNYQKKVDHWIGADLGALILAQNDLPVHDAVGDFDSIDANQQELIKQKTDQFHVYPEEKEETDLEIALCYAFDLKPEAIYLFGVTGGRLDHALINIQLLHRITAENIRGVIIDQWNQVELTTPGPHIVYQNHEYPYISFVPFTEKVKNLSLTGFYYPLNEYVIAWGSTRCISNELIAEQGTFTYDEGMLLLIKSCEV